MHVPGYKLAQISIKTEILGRISYFYKFRTDVPATMRLICFLLVSLPLLSSGQTLGDYRSFQSGPWSAASSWARFDGSVWVNPAPAPPSSAAAGVVTIRSPHAITVTANQDTDETVVQSGGTLTINSGITLTIADGNLTDLSNAGTVNSSAEADLVFSSGASYAHARNGGTIPPATWNSNTTCSVTGVTNTAPGGLNPAGGFFHFVWSSPQTFAIDLGGNLVDINGNFTLQNSNGQFLRMSTSASPTIDIDGNIIIEGPFSRFAFTTTGTPTIDVGGDFIFTSPQSPGTILSGAGSFTLTVHGNLDVNAPGGTLSFSNGGSNSIFNLEGDLILTAGTITETFGTGTFNFVSGGTQTFTNSGLISAIIHYNIAAGTTLDVIGESVLSGTGTLTVNGNLRVGSLNPLGAIVLGNGSGNIRTTGRVYNAGAVVTYAGTGPQFIGNGQPTSANVETEIDNASGVTFNTTTAGNSGGNNLVIAGLLRLTNGDLNIVSSGGVTRHFNFSGSIVDNGNAIALSGTTTDLTIGGSGALGNFPLPAGATTIRTLTVNRAAGSVDFGNSLTATGVTSVQNGTVDFNADASLTGGLSLSAGTTVFFEGQPLTIGGNFITTGGVLSSDFGSVLTLTGSAAFSSALAFSPTANNLSSLVLNKSNAGNSVTINSTLNIGNALTLTDGQLNIVGNSLVMAADADLTRHSNASISTSSPAGGPWDLTYIGDSQTTGLEIPVTGALASLTINGNNASVVTLAQAVAISGALNISAAGRTLNSAAHNVTVGSFISAGTFNAPSSAASVGLSLNGGFTNDGTFNHNSGTIVIDGSSTFGGTSINATNFNNITIAATGDLVAPANLIVQGNFTNDGTFTAGSGTVVFNGSVGSKVLSGTSDSQFNNFSLTKLNAGLSLTVSSTQTVNGTLTLTAGQLSIVGSQLLLANGSTIVKNSSSSIITSSPGGGPWHLIYVSGTQTTSLEIPSTGDLLSLTINVDNSRVVTLSQAVTISGALSIPLSSRTLTSGSNNITAGSISNAGVINAPTSGASVGLTLNGDFANNGTFGNAGGTVVINGPSVFSGVSMDGTFFNNITISATGTLTPSAVLNLNGNFTNNGGFVAGSGVVNFAGATAARVLSGTSNTVFNDLTVNKPNAGVSLTVSSTQTVNGTLTLTQGQVAITGSSLLMGNGATIVRNSAGSISSSSPGGGPYHLSYVGGSLSAGLEISATPLASLTINSSNSSVVTLTSAATVTGAFTNGLAGRSFTSGGNDLAVGSFTNAGAFSAPTSAATNGLTLNGDFTNDGTFTHNSGTVRVAGTVSMLGTAINTTNFHTIIITGSLTPPSTLNVQGSFTNNGTFVAGAGTVVFSGTTGSHTLGGTTNTNFNNITLNKSNGGVSITVASAQTVTNTLTLTQGQFSITASNLQMSNGSTLTRNAAASIVTASPGGGPWNLIYIGGSMSTGLEIPATNLQTLTVNSNSGAVISLASAVAITGALTISTQAVGPTFTSGNNTVSAATLVNGGVFNAPTGTLTLTGDLTNNGTFNRGTGTVVFAGNSVINGSNNPTLNHTTITGTLTSPSNFLIAGNFTNNGTFDANGGVVSFNGSSAQSITGSTTTLFNNINANNAAGVRVEGNANLGGVLTLGSGVQFDADGVSNGGVFTLLSLDDEPTADASIATIPGTSAVTGSVTVQRFMRAKGTVNRYISSPVSNATVSDLSDDFSTEGPRYYDETVLGDINQGYTYVGDASALVPGRGYLFFMWDGASSANWDLRGPLTSTQNQGPVDLNVSHTPSTPADPDADGWNLVGNPYPSAIAWDNGAGWSKTDIAPIIYVPDIAAGVYRTWNADSPGGDLPGGVITMGQAFWVYAEQPGAELIVNESAKTSASGTFFRQRGESPSATMVLSLTHKEATDNSFITIQPDATDDYDRGLDGYKLDGVFSIATTGQRGRNMVFNAVSDIDDSWTMPVYVNGEPGTYSISFSPQGEFPRMEDIYLVDMFEGKAEKISAMQSYEFEISEDARSKTNRFYLSLDPARESTPNESSIVLSVYPNPVVDELSVEINGTTVGETVLLNDVGRIVDKIEMIREGGKHRGTLSVGRHADGLYIVRSVVDGRVMAIKLVKN